MTLTRILFASICASLFFNGLIALAAALAGAA